MELLLKGCVVTFVACAVNYSMGAAQLSLMLLEWDTKNACLFCWLMVPKWIKLEQ